MTGEAVREITPSVEKKDWGVKRTVFYGPDRVLVEHASPRKGGYSSRHYHAENFNEFYLLAGRMVVLIYADEHGDAIRTITLQPGQRLTVPPQTWHRFECLDDCELLEVYWKPGLAVGDIVRTDTGGMRPCE